MGTRVFSGPTFPWQLTILLKVAQLGKSNLQRCGQGNQGNGFKDTHNAFWELLFNYALVY